MHSGSNSGGKWDTFLSQALCVNPFVVPSLIKCHCPDYPAVRQTSKWASSDGREQGGGGLYSNEMLTDPATITNHQSDLISWLAEWVGGLVHIRPTLPSCRACFSINRSLHTQPNHWSSTVEELVWGGDVSALTRFETKVKAVKKRYLQLWINLHM